MKKKIWPAVIFIILCFFVTGCKNTDEQSAENDRISIQKEIVKFVNEDLSAIDIYKATAIESYNSYFLDDTIEVDAFLSELNAAAIPNIKEYIKQLEEINIDGTEVMELRDLLLLAAKTQKEAMELTARALEEENADYLTRVDSLISQAGEYMTEYDTRLKGICDEYNIEIQ